MKNRFKQIALLLCAAVLLSSASFAAGSRQKTFTAYYNDIKLVVDGITVTPKDANGTVVEPFIMDGTTYLPVRAVGEALGKTVKWDGDNYTVLIGQAPGEAANFVDVCKPYEKTSYLTPETVNVMGVTYVKSIVIGEITPDRRTSALFNLNGQYSTLKFDLGHVDGTALDGGVLKFYLNGELSATIDCLPEMLVTHYEVPLHRALQLKIVFEGGGTRYSHFAILNSTIE